MNFYQRYPMMRPYVGDAFRDRDKPSLLLIGESHYLPGESTQHLNAGAWYEGGAETLSPDETEWISTAAILRDSRAAGFSNKAHSIWSNAFREINEHGPQYADYREVADNIAFYNFFLRPGLEGESLDVCAQDVQFANEAFHAHYDALKPSAVIFLSSLAHFHFQPSQPLSAPIIATPHPGCKWWNRVAQKYGNKKGREILAEFIATTTWR
jgi:hypothetical protein